MTDISVEVVLNKSEELRRAGAHVEAIMLLTDALDDHLDAGLYYARGCHFWLDNQPERAVLDFTRAIELNPNYARAYFSRGHVFSYYLDRKDQAIDDFEKYLRLKPDDAEVHRECCTALLMMLRPERAWEHALATMKLDPDNPVSLFCMARSQIALRQFGNATQSLMRAVELDSQNANYWASLGRAREEMGGKTNLVLAEQAYTRAIELSPNSADYFYFRGDLRLRLEIAEDGVADLRHALNLNPNEAILMLINIRLASSNKLGEEKG